MNRDNKVVKHIEDLVPLDNIEDIYPLTDIQKGMIYHTQKNPYIGKYHNQIVQQYRIPHFDPGRFQKAFALMADKHPVLRTGFNMYDFEESIQIVRKKVPLDIQHKDISHLEKNEQETYIKKSLAEDREKPFSFTNASPLWRIITFSLDSEMIFFTWICHHALMDGWSLAILLTELYDTYSRLESNPHFIPVKLKSTYKQFVLEQIAMSKNKEIADYWKKQMADYQRVNLGMITHSKKESREKEWYRCYLGPHWLEKLKPTAGKYDTSIKHLCFGAYVYSISQFTYKNDIVVGLVTTTRPQCEDSDKLLGCFLNTVPVRMKIPQNEKWGDYIHKVEKKMRELKKYDKLSLFNIRKAIGEQTHPENPIFDTLFNFVDFFVYPEAKKTQPQYTGNDIGKIPPGNRLSINHFEETNTLYDFSVDITWGTMNIYISYHPSVFTKKTVEKLCRCFEDVLNYFIYEPESLIKKEHMIETDHHEMNSSNLARANAKTGKIEFHF
jgi:tyrocidine synthetase-3